MSLLMFVALLAGCGPAAEAHPGAAGAGGESQQGRPGVELAGLIPAPAAGEGWRIVEGPVEHSPEDLWEHLDGGAPRYLTYGFRKLVHVRCQIGDDPLAGVALDVFDMGSELGAFGIYSIGRSPGDPLRPWGAEGHRQGAVAAAWKESVFVHAAADDERDALISLLERLVAGVCERIDGSDSRPSLLDPLPVAGLVPRSERYIAQDLLGHDFLPGGVLADYVLDGREAQLFYSDLSRNASAASALAQLRAHESSLGGIAGEITAIGDAGFRFKEPGLGSGAVVRAGRFVAGIFGDAPEAARDAVLRSLVSRLGPASPAD
jgi:hypothetical protein